MDTRNELLELSEDLLDGQQTNLIMGGHGMIDMDGNFETKTMGVFREETKTIVEDLVNKNRHNYNIKAIAVINDWSLIDDPSGEVREKFWRKMENKEYFKIPIECQFVGYGTHGCKNTIGSITEKGLQNQYRNLLRSSRANGLDELISKHTGEVCSVTEDGEISSVCEDSRCAIEVLMMLDLFSREYRNMIAFMPKFCFGPIESAIVAFSDPVVRKKLNNTSSSFEFHRIYLNSNRPFNFQDMLTGMRTYTSNLIDSN